MTSESLPDLYVISSGIRFEERLLLSAASNQGAQVQHIVDTNLLVGDGRLIRGNAPVLLRTPSYFRSCVIASWLEARGHRVANDLAAVSRFGIKSRTDDWLKGKGIPTIPFRICLDSSQLPEAARQLGFPLVVKPDIGGFGTRVHLVRDEPELRQLSEYILSFSPTHIRYVLAQKYCHVLHDLRVLIVDGKLVAVMDRVHENALVKNVAEGGHGREYALQPPELGVVDALCACLPVGYFGLDVFVTPEGPVVCEVNATCRFSELTKVSGIDIASMLVRSAMKGVM